MNIRKRLKDTAELQLNQMVEQLEKRAIELADEYPIEPKELLKLAAGGRTGVLTNKLTSRMAIEAETEMIAQYEKQQEIY